MNNKMGGFKNSTSSFEILKTIRFELKPVPETFEKLKNILPGKNSSPDVNHFIEILKIFCSNLETVIFRGIFLRKEIEVKYGWLRSYTKNDFYAFQKRIIPDGRGNFPKKYSIAEPEYLEKELQRWSEEWKGILNSLKTMAEAPLENQKRRREFAQSIRNLKKRQNFEFAKEFIKALCNTNDIEIDSKIDNLRILAKGLEAELRNIEKEFLPSQSAGLQIARGSFNYYTLNKTPKSLEEEEKSETGKLKLPMSSFMNKRSDRRFILDEKYVFIDKETKKETKEYSALWTLDEAYKKLKQWKAEQKSEFLEAVQKKSLTVDNFTEKFPLFGALKEDFQTFLDLTEKIEVFNEEKSQAKDENRKQLLSREIKSLKQQRGSFFNKPRENEQTKNYFKLCELFKNIALSRGQILAKIKGIENEKKESQSLQYWSLILEEQEKLFLVMIPRGENENHKKAKAFIGKNFYKENGEIKLYHFKSLTLRALEKLCFKEFGNTFAPEIKKERIEFPRYKQEWKQQEARMVEFYQKVLRSQYANTFLDIVDFGGLRALLECEYKKIADFGSDLEKNCYIKKELHLNEKEKTRFLEDYAAIVFEIASYDLRIENEKRLENKSHKNKNHTQIWKDFWTSKNKDDKYKIRLNPEIKVFWREADEELKEKIKEGEIRQPKKLESFRNRYMQEHFNLAVNIALNAAEKRHDLAFKTSEDIAVFIQEYNDDFNHRFQGKWFYGIDRGIKELATLCVMRFTDQTYDINGRTFLRPEFPRIEVWKLKDENYSEVARAGGSKSKNEAIKNISYFLDSGRESLFEKDTVSCVDLTTAKLINGKIVLNGDLMTYYKLKDYAAKRQIFDLFSHSKISGNSEIRGGKATIIIKDKDQKDRQIYWISPRQKELSAKNYSKIKNKEQVLNDLKRYLKNLDVSNAKEDIITVDKINHLRDAITANMVGIIAHLQKSYPGIIAFEDMESESNIQKHFNQSNEDISRRLEWALYRRFQTESLVPPQIKQTVFLRDEFENKQFGIIQFVNMENTSKNCPRCENTFRKTDDHQHYICNNQNCNFSSKGNRLEFEPLNDSDKVAAFNVAKNAFNEINK